MIFALTGNQNCGKTTLFNALTGSNQHVGNFPGVTVEQKTGQIKGERNITLVDLPGIYSLRPYTPEEIITRDFLLKEKPDGIINIVSAVNPERNLYLTLQLLELGIPTVIALSMTDELKKNGGRFDTEKLSRRLGVPVIPICANRNAGIEELITAAEKQAKNGIRPIADFYPSSNAVKRCIDSVEGLTKAAADKQGIPSRFLAVKIVEGDLFFRFSTGANDKTVTEETHKAIRTAEKEIGTDINAALAELRYSFIEKICAECITKPQKSRGHKRSLRLDRLLTGRATAFPVFLLVLFAMFFLTFRVIGGTLSNLLANGIEKLTAVVSDMLISRNVNQVIQSLITDGIFTGVGSVLSFLPVIVVLFFFLSILEDTGYMARVAFIMDKPMRKIGLSGKSFVPMLLGFGCTVPAVMATRTISSERDRKMTVLLTPFMSCSAKIPVYAVFASVFFKGREPVVMLCLYLCGGAVGALAALLLRNTLFRGESVPFLMELPDYRLPSPKNVGLLILEKAKDFLQRAFTVIFLSSVTVWFLQTFDTKLTLARDSANSILALFGRVLTPVFAPLGFGDWRVVTSLISGFTAKEAVISTMSVLFGVSAAELPLGISRYFTTASAISFLVFALLYTPCIAAVTAIKKELGGTLKTVCAVFMQCATAWLVAFLFFQAAKILGY